MNRAEAKAAAHAAFDRLWKSGRMSRDGAYRLLTRALRFQTRAHISDLSVAQCRFVIRWATYALGVIPKPRRMRREEIA